MVSISRSIILRFHSLSNSRYKRANHGPGKKNHTGGDKFWSTLLAEHFSTILWWSWLGSQDYATCMTGKSLGILGLTLTHYQDTLKLWVTFWSYLCARISVSTLLTDFSTIVFCISTFISSIMRSTITFRLLLSVVILLNSWFQTFTHLFQELFFSGQNCTLWL